MSLMLVVPKLQQPFPQIPHIVEQTPMAQRTQLQKGCLPQAKGVVML